MSQLDGLPGWGATLKLSGPTDSVSVAQINNRVTLKVGCTGFAQSITIPNSTTLISGARILIVGDAMALREGNESVITDGVLVVTISVFGETAEIAWTGTAWVVVSGEGSIFSTGATDGSVPNGTGVNTYTWTGTPKISKVRFVDASRELTATDTRIRSVDGSLETFGADKFQGSVSPVVSYSGTDTRAKTGYRVFVHTYSEIGSAAPAAQTIDFNLTYLTADYSYQPDVAINAFRAMIVACTYQDGAGAADVAHFATNGIHVDNPVGGRQVSASTTAVATWTGGETCWTFAWSAPSAHVLRLVATPQAGAENATLAIRLEVFGTTGKGPNGGV